MKLIDKKNTVKTRSSKFVVQDVYCPICYPEKESGFVDGGLVYDGDMVEWKCHRCNYKWLEVVKL